MSARRRQRPGLALLALFAVALSPAGGWAENRHLAMILDTSGSMQGNDPKRYTVQLSQILGDLLDDSDRLTIVRMPVGMFTTCADGASPQLARSLDPADRAGFKRQLDALVHYEDGTHFAAPIRTAAAALASAPKAPRMLLIISDDGGLGDCAGVLTEELLRQKAAGVAIAAINLGVNGGAFDTNPAFSFTTAAQDAEELARAVALVYQKFLGAKQVQTGRVEGAIKVQIAPFVSQAFLVVAAEGPVGALAQSAGNPPAAAVDLDYRGGGETRGLDGRTRGYRIVRLRQPAPGSWSFTASGLDAGAGWMLIQESSVGLRPISSPTVPKGMPVPLELELYDQSTGRRIPSGAGLPGLAITAEIDGKKVTFRDDGQNGDHQPGDGIFTATATFEQTGARTVPVHLESSLLDRQIAIEANVVDASWAMKVTSPGQATAGAATPLSVELQPIGPAAALSLPDRVEARGPGGTLAILRAGGPPGSRTFTGSWTPAAMGTTAIDYAAIGGSPAAPARAPVTVLGRLVFGRPVAVALGRGGAGSVLVGRLDLASAQADGDLELAVTSDYRLARSALEIDPGGGWVPLGAVPQRLRLAPGGARSWPVRLRIGSCPPASAGRRFLITVAAAGANVAPAPDGRLPRCTVPLAVEVVPESWLRCWWPVIALCLGAIALGVIAYGYWSPSRFSPRLGVVLSPEADMNEGFLHPIRGQRGSRSGWFRDARIYVCHDYRLAGRPRHAVARLRADAAQVRIAAAAGEAVWRQGAEGGWEPLPPGESTARFGTVYRNDLGSLYFELRNA